MNALVLIGRILFAVLFLSSAVNHLTKTEAMVGYTASRGVPAAKAATVLSGVVLLAGGLSVLLGIWADLGAVLLAIFLAAAAVSMHAFWRESEGQARQMEMIHFMKDMALCGASLMLIAFFAHTGHSLGLTVTGPLFHLD
ncbi:DoxX family protein [Kitasatospora sp. NPDC001603]|uniref:DoxX family protein n=1 Tax=Kitasatospora sp. NPDC001603 TaxID=3154388 RepID=UPI0033203B1E